MPHLPFTTSGDNALGQNWNVVYDYWIVDQLGVNLGCNSHLPLHCPPYPLRSYTVICSLMHEQHSRYPNRVAAIV